MKQAARAINVSTQEDGEEAGSAEAELLAKAAGRKQRRKKKASKSGRKSIVAAINAEAASTIIADEAYHDRKARALFIPLKGDFGTLFFVKTLRAVATKDHSSSNPPKGNPPDLKTKVDVSKVDVKGFPTFHVGDPYVVGKERGTRFVPKERNHCALIS